jgi:GTP-binding protein HflX
MPEPSSTTSKTSVKKSRFKPYITAQPVEKAILVGVRSPGQLLSVEDSLAELARLTDTAGAEVVATYTQNLKRPVAATLIGSGKVAEVAGAVQQYGADIVIFDDELTPTQQDNLEKRLGAPKALDRTALILDIFGMRAQTREGRLQVRLAQDQYLLPRLRGMWSHLASGHMGGGVGGRFGEGESQLEIDRRMVRRRIERTKAELARVQAERDQQRKRRHASGVFKVALAGYTNAGKSTLLNILTKGVAYADDKLFATLDSTTRQALLPDGRGFTVTDTVGFIQKLPTTLVKAFNSTLEEIIAADLICHVIDASSPYREQQMRAVQDTLEQIGAAALPITPVFNKCDLLDGLELHRLRQEYPEALLISAADGSGLEELLRAVQAQADRAAQFMDVVLPYDQGALVSLAYERCQVLTMTYTEDGACMGLKVPLELASRFSPYQVVD